ncbi:MAG: hypothetical protein KKA07_06395 [Bacteroidetes bacterium]|nr:hypothetical protein [Bacteroidota bacterium]MBU1718685.1 hypothetical protein [Bacteroidota bacterium]
MKTAKVLILLDSDVVIHLFKAEKISLLMELFPQRVVMLDYVYEELMKNPTVRSFVENLFLWKQVQEIKFPIALFNEFKLLKSRMAGIGERACLVYCKHNNHIIASSNTKDIVPYCTEHSIAYLTTLDIFAVAVERKKMTVDEANNLIQKITLNNESYLCCYAIEAHLKYHFKVEKLLC